ncbi:hypothetical protein [Comamonas endophytica]|uniref:Lipoprotein n=1 Tax=Comamonas endophytica TaxID=2949090 RepID=A0ABY6GD42_9BURK|nr:MULTISPECIES: hypothetical protein [unclassified Acidovorax]MCD2512649.1 hypothetical protein [Acidovorax sp. D4N7]UYG52993.1 hypothetical protein M9799_07190 [Acidovorax sp. 5MLIR]
MKSLAVLALGATLGLTGCASLGVGGAEPVVYDYALSCKLKEDDPSKCEAQVRALCPAPEKAKLDKRRTVDPKDNAVIYVYQAKCNP